MAENFESLLLLVDVDGVVTDEHARVSPEVVASLAHIASSGGRVAFITGRSRAWLDTRLTPRLAPLLDHGVLRERVLFAAEMGALRCAHSTGNEWKLSAELAVPDGLRDELRPMIDGPAYAGLVEWDGTKEATATFEAIHRPAVAGHAERARAALRRLAEEVTAVALAAGCRAALSTYALDVLVPDLTKAIGARFALDEFAHSSAKAQVLVFGDSPGDAVMATVACEWGSDDVEFVWLGRGVPPALEGIPIQVAVEPHAPGMADFLHHLVH